jgi:tricorn protease
MMISALLLPFCLATAPLTQTAQPRLLRTPDVRGSTIVFSYAGDLWAMDIGSTAGAKRLTHHSGIEIRPKISPDGKWVAFSGSIDARGELYVVPLAGGDPRRLTFSAGGVEPLGWTPEGKIAYRASEESWSQADRLWLIGVEGGLPARTVIGEVGEASFFPDGSIAFTRNLYQQYLSLRHYGGGSQGRVSLYNFSTNKYQELPVKGGSYTPMAVGQSIYYTSDKNRTRQNLYRFDLVSKRETRLTSFQDADIRWPSTDGKSMVWERDGYLEHYDIGSGKVQRQTPTLPVSELVPQAATKQLSSEVSHVALANRDLAVEAHGEVFRLGSKPSNVPRTGGAREKASQWSPDGKTLAFLSDATGEWEVYTYSVDSSAKKQVSEGKGIPFNTLKWSRDGARLALTSQANDLYVQDLVNGRLTKVPKQKGELASLDWSADSKVLAFTYALIPDTPIPLGSTPLGSLYFYELESGMLRQLTSGYYDSQVAFDANGRYLYLVSTRTFNPGFGNLEFSLKVEKGDRIYIVPLQRNAPNPLRSLEEQAAYAGSGSGIDYEGLLERAMPLPMPGDDYPAIFGGRDGVFYATRTAGSQELTLSRFDLAQQASSSVFVAVKTGVPPRSAISFSPDLQRVAALTRKGVSVIEVAKPAEVVDLELSDVAATIDPREEWRQIFWEAWRFQRDTYYDARMNGVNWTAVGRRYATYLPSLTNRADLSYLLLQMIGELGTSHSFVGNPRPAQPPPAAVGFLGADYEVANGFVQLKKIYRGQNFDESRQAPLGEPGIRVEEGDYLLAIDGEPVNRGVSPGQLLLGKAGKFVSLTFNANPTNSGARTIRVRPVEDESSLRYAGWVEANRKYVDKMSGGRIGYLHLPDTWTGGATEFIRGFYAQTHKEALLIDERYNLGGLAQPFLVPTLARQVLVGSVQRNGPNWFDSYAHRGPKALLINQFAGSGGDLLPWMFRRMGLGTLIGRRTAGLFTGYFERLTFVDGGNISAAQLGYFDPNNGKPLPENFGTSPDIEVDLTPDQVALGKDPQLDEGVKHLMKKLKEKK